MNSQLIFKTPEGREALPLRGVPFASCMAIKPSEILSCLIDTERMAPIPHLKVFTMDDQGKLTWYSPNAVSWVAEFGQPDPGTTLAEQLRAIPADLYVWVDDVEDTVSAIRDEEDKYACNFWWYDSMAAFTRNPYVPAQLLEVINEGRSAVSLPATGSNDSSGQQQTDDIEPRRRFKRKREFDGTDSEVQAIVDALSQYNREQGNRPLLKKEYLAHIRAKLPGCKKSDATLMREFKVRKYSK